MNNKLEWHQECLKNQKAHNKRESEYIANLTKRIVQSELDTCIYSSQIDLAIKEKKDSFDRERYGLKRKTEGGKR
jgi:hypothetical protein